MGWNMLLIMILTLSFSLYMFYLWWTEIQFVILVNVGFYRKNFRFDNEEDFQKQLQVCITQAF